MKTKTKSDLKIIVDIPGSKDVDIFENASAKPKWSSKKVNDLKYRFLLLNGPNLNMLGRREPSVYGNFTLADVENLTTEKAAEFGYKVECFQSNHEGAIIDKIHNSIDLIDGIIINPGAFTHYSYAIYDALLLSNLPVVEIHISDISTRESFRRVSVIRPACIDQVKGLGINGYAKAVEILANAIEKHIIRKI